jgi:hypothetical protein
MPAIVACPNCKKKYNLPEKFLGKAIKCKSCDKAFKTRVPAAQGQRSAQPAKKLPASLRNQASADELARLGIDGPLKAQPDIFAAAPPTGADPLANHVVQDPGFRAPRKRKSESDDDINLEDEGLSDLYDNSAIAQQAALKGGKDKQKRKKEDKLLKSYMREDLFAEDREDQEVEPSNGISRTAYFWLTFGMSCLANGVVYLGALASEVNANQEFSAEAMSAFPVLMFIALILAFTIVPGLGFGFLTYGRMKNVGFKKALWPTLLACAAGIPFLFFLIAIILLMTGVVGAAGIVFMVGLVLLALGYIPLQYMCIAFPTDFAVTKKYDLAAWIWTGIYAASFVFGIGGAIISTLL